MHEPWQAIRQLVGWEVFFTDRLPAGVVAATRWADRTIWFSTGLTPTQLRCAAEHERQHALRGPARPEESPEQVELEVDLAAVRELLHLEDMLEVASCRLDASDPEDFAIAADLLGVTVRCLGVRLAHMTSHELALVVERIAA